VPYPADTDSSFASGVAAHFQEFCRTVGDPKDVVVRIVLIDGDRPLFNGLRIESVTNVPGCVMIRGLDAAADEALVVREDHILRAEFLRNPPPPAQFGFSA
jgi:hypothetical protein